MFDLPVDKQLFGWYYNFTEQTFAALILTKGQQKLYITRKDVYIN